MRARGFTLIELMVAMAVSLVAVAAGVVLLRASYASFHTSTDERALQETARVAMDELLSRLRTAGYGLDPTFAIDPGLAANTVMDRIPFGKQARFGGYCGEGAYSADGSCPRDSITGPDELVFYSRDPDFMRDVDAIGVTNTLTLREPVDLKKGQILQVMCYGTENQWLWAFVTVSSVADPAGTPVVTLQGPASGGTSYDFPFQTALLTENACFKSGTVRAFKIDTWRYYVAAVDANGEIQPWETPGTRPYLMLDQGLSESNKPIRLAVAPDVEDLQVAYVFPMATAGSQVLGAEPGALVSANVADDDSGFNLAPGLGIPSYSKPSLDPIRTTHHPANTRAVRVAITVRGQSQDFAKGSSKVPPALNRPEVNGEGGYTRAVFESSAYVQNLTTRLSVFPTYDSNFATNCCAPGATCSGNCGGG